MALALPIHRLPWLRSLAVVASLGIILGVFAARAIPQIQHRNPAQLTQVEMQNLELMSMTQADLDPDFTLSFSEPLRRMIPHRTDGLVQPLWPWMAAWMGDGTDLVNVMQGTALFRLGMAGGFLLLLGIICARHFSLPAALWIVLIGAIHGLLPVLPYFTGESLHQITLVILWLACLQAMRQNSLWVYAAIGGIGAVAWLSEARLVLPIIIVFLLVATMRSIWGWAAAHFVVQPRRSLWLWRNHWLGSLMLIASFLVVTGPRLADAHQRFGEAFFSHADHARWLSDAKAAQNWIATHQDAESLKRIPVLDRPSMANTLSTESLPRILERLRRGAWLLTRPMAGVLPPLAGMLALVLLLTILLQTRIAVATHAGQKLHPETATVVLFSLTALIACLITACWDAQVLPVRYARALILPIALSLAWAAEALISRARRRGASRLLIHGYQVLMWLLLGWTAFSLRLQEV